MYEDFTARLAELDSLWFVARDAIAPLQAKLDSELRAAWKKAMPRKRFPGNGPATEALGTAGAAICEPLKAEADKIGAQRIARKDALEAELRSLAATLPLPDGGKLRPMLHEEIGTDRYRSQGWGAAKYARADAQRSVDKARMHGLAAEVHELHSKYYPGSYGGSTHVVYGVFVDTTPLGWQILQRKPHVPLREVVRLSWARGVNPRVTYPFLPHGYEEKEGLDHFGGEIRSA